MHSKTKGVLSYLDVECAPVDWLRFVQLDPFPKKWERLGLNYDDDLSALEILIMTLGDDPRFAPVVPGTSGLRKLRSAPPGHQGGKRGALRVCYGYFKEHGIVVLITVYGKGEKDDLTADDKKVISAVLRRIQGKLERGLIQ